MGRRALRKLDPDLDLSQHLKTIDELPQPFDSTSLFAHSAPLEVEIGSGKGLFMSTASADKPDHNFLGIEISFKYARFAAAKLAKARRDNAVMIHGDAERLLGELLPAEAVSAIHVYFPDPWWKKRHKKRRIMNEKFLQHVERSLTHGGTLHFWTDVEEYFLASLEVVSDTTSLEGPLAVTARQPQHDLDYQTHFERRMRTHDLEVYRAAFCKSS